MTFQKRLIIDIPDVLVIRLTCQKCQASTLIPPAERFEIHDKCGNCGNQLFLREDIGKRAIEFLMSGLVDLRKRGKDAPCNIQLEIEPPT